MSGGMSQRLRAFAEKDGRGYPDWAMRYLPVVRRLNSRGSSARRILEIGANQNGLSRFLDKRVVAVDVEAEHLMEARATQNVLPVVASIDQLPFADDAFDVCASVDTFEHIPSRQRTEAVKEVARVMAPRAAAVITFPSGEGAAEAEAWVRNRYEAHCGGTLRWLEEHAQEGLPDPGPIFIQFQRSLGESHRVSVAKNANLRVWRWMWLVLMCGWPGRGNALVQAGLRVVTPVLTRLHAGHCYRVMVWVEPRSEAGS